MPGIKLIKKYYGAREAKEKLDTKIFQLLPEKITIKKFFQLYNQFFYNIPENLHREFIRRSIEYIYPDGYINPRQIEINNLKSQIDDIKEQIDSVEKEHPYFKNGTFIMDIIHNNNPQPAISEGKVFYMHSKKKRPVLSYNVYQNLKNKILKSRDPIEDSNFTTFIDNDTLIGIATGPPIEKTEDIYVPILEINRYGQALVGDDGDIIIRD